MAETQHNSATESHNVSIMHVVFVVCTVFIGFQTWNADGFRIWKLHSHPNCVNSETNPGAHPVQNNGQQAMVLMDECSWHKSV